MYISVKPCNIYIIWDFYVSQAFSAVLYVFMPKNTTMPVSLILFICIKEVGRRKISLGMYSVEWKSEIKVLSAILKYTAPTN